MKTTFTFLFLLLACLPALSQSSSGVVLASLKAVGDLTEPESIRVHSSTLKSTYSFRPVTVLYQDSPWHLTIVDSPEEKQVLHFTDEQLQAIAAIVEAGDGKTHYLEITNFFEVFASHETARINQAFLSKMGKAIEQKRWYKNNSIFMISATTVAGEPVVRFKLPFYTERRICRHTRTLYNLEEDYYETSPEQFMRFLIPDAPFAQQ